MAAIYKAERVVRNTSLLIHCAKILGIHILATTQYKKGLGPFVPELEELLTDEPCVDKIEFNGFANPGVSKMINSLPKSIDTILLAGAEAHICIFQTCLSIVEKGWVVHVPHDAVDSRTNENWRIGLDLMNEAGACITSTETVIYQILKKAGTTAFKKMLKVMK